MLLAMREDDYGQFKVIFEGGGRMEVESSADRQDESIWAEVDRGLREEERSPPVEESPSPAFRRLLGSATQIRCLMDEIAHKIVSRTTNSELIAALRLLSGIIDPDTVVAATHLWEKKRVRLFAPRSDEMFPRKKWTTTVVDEDSEDDDKMEEDEESGDGPRDEAATPQIQKPAYSRTESLGAEMTRPGRADAEGALELSPRFSAGPRGAVVAQISRASSSSSPEDSATPGIFVLPSANYCACDYFTERVLEKRTAFTCAHWLAAWLALATGQQIEPNSIKTLSLMRAEIVRTSRRDEDEVPEEEVKDKRAPHLDEDGDVIVAANWDDEENSWDAEEEREAF